MKTLHLIAAAINNDHSAEHCERSKRHDNRRDGEERDQAAIYEAENKSGQNGKGDVGDHRQFRKILGK